MESKHRGLLPTVVGGIVLLMLTFLVFQLVPGSPLQGLRQQRTRLTAISEEDYQRLEEFLGLEDSGQPEPAAPVQASPPDESQPAEPPQEGQAELPTAQPQAAGEAQQILYPSQERMVIKNGEIDLLVEDTNSAIGQVMQIATRYNGYVLSSQVIFQGEVTVAMLTITVEAASFESAMNQLREIGVRVLREEVSGEDVAGEYVDLESRLRNLELTRDRVRAFLDQATTVGEAMQVNTQLSEIEDEIETVKGRMEYLAGRSAYSTITVRLEPPMAITPTPTPTPTATPTPTPTPLPPWSPGPALSNAAQTQVEIARALFEGLIWTFIVPGPYIVVGGLAAWRVWAMMRQKKSPPPRSAPPPEES